MKASVDVPASGIVATGPDPGRIGIRVSGEASTAVRGLIDEVRIYDKALTDQEIAALYAAVPSPPVELTPVAYWNFDGTGNIAPDLAPGGTRPATLMNGATRAASMAGFGQALQLDGVDDFAEYQNDGAAWSSSEFTFSAWVKASYDNPGELGYVLSRVLGESRSWLWNRLVGRWGSPESGIRIGDTNAYVTASGAVHGSEEWHHLVVRYDGAQTQTYSMFVDGVKASVDVPASGIVATGPDPGRIGIRVSGEASTAVRGLIDEVRIYDKALTDQEIASLYATVPDWSTPPAPPTEPGTTTPPDCTSWSPSGGMEGITGRDVIYDYAGTRDPEAVDRLLDASGDFATYDYTESGAVSHKWVRDTGTWDFTYDGYDRQRRVVRQDSGASELYYYGGAERWLAVERDSAGAAQKVRFWFGPDEIHYDAQGEVTKRLAHITVGTQLARIEDGSKLEYIYSNGLGNMMASVSDDGTEVTSFIYSPFGEVIASTGDVDNHSRRFNDKVVDDVSGLSYYGYRYYDNLSMTWTRGDPLFRFAPDLAYDQPRKMNIYAFSANNPVRYLDPDGLSGVGVLEGVVAVGAVIGKAGVAAAVLPVAVVAGGIGVIAGLRYRSGSGSARASDEKRNFAREAEREARREARNARAVASLDKASNEVDPSSAPRTSRVSSTPTEPPKMDGPKKPKKGGPKPNDGNAKPHGGPTHDAAIDKKVSELQQNPGATNIRKNQQQVDVNGNKVGTNRPDVQYDEGGCHTCVEYDNSAKASQNHGERIRAADPRANVELNQL